MPHYRKVIKTGNSLALTLPSQLTTDLNIQEGDIAQVKINKSKAKISYIFTGHPRQLSLIQKNNK